MLYAALAPSPQTSTVLKSACRTWEDYLWAQVCIICEEKQSIEMFELGGGFWECNQATVEGSMESVVTERDEDAWEAEVLASLDDLKNVQVQEG
jgi:nuclear pore complex protein Nup107